MANDVSTVLVIQLMLVDAACTNETHRSHLQRSILLHACKKASRAREITKPSKTNYWRRMASGWTPERTAQQAQAIRRWRPWEHAIVTQLRSG